MADTSLLAQRLNLLAGSLALDEQFRQEFMLDRIGAIERFNSDFALRYRQKLLEFSESELKLVAALNASTLDEFLALIATIASVANPKFLPKAEPARTGYIVPAVLPTREVSDSLAS